MDISIVDRFKAKKQKVILTYAKIIEMIITLQENTLWQKASEFTSIAEGVINYFVDNYYFDNNLNRNNPVEYLNDNINAVIISIMEYYKKINQTALIKEKKNETFLLSTIICTASYVDIAANVVDGNYAQTKKNFQKLLKHLSQTEILKVYYHNKMYLDKLFTAVRQNMNNEKKFFNYFQNPHWHNEYQLISNNPPYYKVRFIYKVNNLQDKDPKLIKKWQRNYLPEYLKISYELLVILIMKEYIMNKKVNVYLIPVVLASSHLDCLDIPLIKDNVKLLVPWEKAAAYENKTNLKCVYYYQGHDPAEILKKRDQEVIVKAQIYDELDLAACAKLNIKIVKEELGSSLTEEAICQMKEED